MTNVTVECVTIALDKLLADVDELQMREKERRHKMTDNEIWAKEPVKSIEEMSDKELMMWMDALKPLRRRYTLINFEKFCRNRYAYLEGEYFGRLL